MLLRDIFLIFNFVHFNFDIMKFFNDISNSDIVLGMSWHYRENDVLGKYHGILKITFDIL